MRTGARHTSDFLGGLTVGLAAAAVALVTIRALRLRAARRSEPVHPVIDGAKPIDPIALALQPSPTASPGRLESEMEDPAPRSQRW